MCDGINPFETPLRRLRLYEIEQQCKVACCALITDVGINALVTMNAICANMSYAGLKPNDNLNKVRQGSKAGIKSLVLLELWHTPLLLGIWCKTVIKLNLNCVEAPFSCLGVMMTFNIIAVLSRPLFSVTTLLVGDSIIGNVHFFNTPTLCLPGAKVPDILAKLPGLLQTAPASIQRIIVHVGINDTV